MKNGISVLSSPEIPDEQIIISAKAGNKAALETIMLRYKNMVYKISSKFYIDGFDKDDIIQEGMIGLYNAVIDFCPDKTDFKNFAALCITRRIITMLRSSQRKKHIPSNAFISLDNAFDDNDTLLFDITGDSKNEDPESIIIDRENLEFYENEAQKLLSPFEFRVWSLHISGSSYKDISEALSKDIKSIDNAIQRIRKKLSRMFEAYIEN